jgi:hypothetical protein
MNYDLKVSGERPLPAQYETRHANGYGMPPGDGAGETLTVRGILAVARRYWWLLAITTLSLGGIAAYLVLNEEPEFRAIATVAIEDPHLAVGSGAGGPPISGGSRSDPYASYIEMLRSSAVLAAAVEQSPIRLQPLGAEPPRLALQVSCHRRKALRGRTLILHFGADSYSVEIDGHIAETAYGAAAELPLLSISLAAPPAGGARRAEFAVLSRQAAARISAGPADRLAQRRHESDRCQRVDSPIRLKRRFSERGRRGLQRAAGGSRAPGIRAPEGIPA